MNNKQAIMKDTIVKILSVLIAIFLWFYVITEQNPVVPKEVTLPIRLVNVESLAKNDLVMLNDLNSFSMTLKLKGKKEILDTVNLNSLTAYADLSGYRAEGEISVPIIINGLPDGVSITSRSLYSIIVSLDKKIVVQRPVTYNLTGNPIGGLASMVPILTPSEVVLTGAESIIDKVKVIRVDIDIAGAGANVNKTLPVKLLDAEGKAVEGIQLNTQNINVTVPIANTKRVPIQLALEGLPAEGYMIVDKFVTPKEILVTGEQGLLEGLNSISTRVITLGNGEVPNVASFEVPAQLELPEGIQLANGNEQIRVYINIQKIVTRTIEVTNLEYRNLNPQLEVANAPSKTFLVTLRGPEALIKEAQNNIALYVDLSRAEAGLNSYAVAWEIAPLLEIVETIPPQIALDIKVRE